MDDNTIFDLNKVQGEPSQVKPQTQQVSTAPRVTMSPNLAKTPWSAPPPVSANDQTKGGFPFSKIIKAFIGILFIVIIAFVIMIFVLPHFEKNKNEKVTVSFWGLWESEATMKSVINDFEKQNPNIVVSYAKQDVKQYRDRVIARIQNGTGPDIFSFHNTWLLQMVPNLLPLSSDVIQKEEFEKIYYPVIKNDLTKDGAIYGIPEGIDTLALFINTEMFSQSGISIPTNWQDFSSAARALTVKDENGQIKTAGAALGTFDNITHAPDVISLLLVQNGADLNNFSQNTQNAIDAFDFYTDFVKGDASVWNETLDPSVLAFAKGNLAMYFGYSWDIFTIKAINPELSFEVAPVPRLPSRKMTIASYWNNGVSVKSKHQKEAMLFIKFLAKKETAEKLFSEASKTRLFGMPYARVDLAESVKNNILVYPFVSQANDATSSFFASDTYDNGLNNQSNAYLGNAVRSILNNTSIETAVDTLTKGVTQIQNQYK